MTGARLSAIFLAGFLLIVLGVGFAIGLTIRPGEWYRSLQKPFFTPPNWVFGPARAIIYVLIAIAGWRVALIEGFRFLTFKLWLLQLILNWAWTPAFFGLQMIGTALIIILWLLAVVVWFMVKVADPLARVCFVPCAMWLVYASSLNGTILFLN